MTLGRKIMGGYAVVLAAMAVAIMTDFYTVNFIQEGFNAFIDVNERLVDGAGELKFEVRDQIAHYRGVLLYPDEYQRYWDDLQEDQRQFAAIVNRMKPLSQTEEERTLLGEIAAAQARHEQAQERVVALARRGRQAEAIALGEKEVRPLTADLIAKADRLREYELKREADGRREVQSVVGRLSLVRSAIFIFALIAGAGIGLFITRSVTLQLREGISRLSASAAEILATTTQVASGSAETATSVNETTATVEEVKQTARLSSEKSKGVSENAQKAAMVARQGDAAVTKTVEGINHVRGLTETVAEGLVRLSEQTQSIGEIIATVNDLAQQSNLLSVNAAIEAAKAGEQGKGFAVVAQEIKSLADQSKQATEQVRSLLTDIQKAASAAVMSAEQASKAVDAGVKQADESGGSIKNLAESVTEAAQAAVQIAASSQQQLVGMDQVAQAMENIKQATQQNVAGIKQAEQAAHNLNEIGQKLKELAGK